jgi:hypothetical protein
VISLVDAFNGDAVAKSAPSTALADPNWVKQCQLYESWIAYLVWVWVRGERREGQQKKVILVQAINNMLAAITVGPAAPQCFGISARFLRRNPCSQQLPI